MKKIKLNKDIFKSIKHSKSRFLSILLLMMLGSFALVGLFVTGPDMRKTGENYFNELNIADITIISDYGIDTSECEYIEKAQGIKEVEYIFLKDVTVKDTNISFRVFSKPENISKYELIEGSLPENDNEIAIDYSYSDNYKLGDTITFVEETNDENEILRIHEFKIVGYIYSGEMVSSLNKGETTVGTGELNSYAIVNKEVFESDVYMMAKLTFTDLEGINPYSDEYTDILQNHKDELEGLLKEEQYIRLEDIKVPYQQEINDGWKEIEDAKQELEDARKELSDAKISLEEAKKEIESNKSKLNTAYSEILNAEAQINLGESEYNSKLNEYNSNVEELNTKKAEYNTAISQIDNTQEEIISKKNELNIAKQQYLKYGETSNEYQYFLSTVYNPGIEQLQIVQNQIDSKLKELSEAKAQIDIADSALSTAKAELVTAKSKLDSSKSELVNAKEEYNNNLVKLNNAESEYVKKENEYNTKLIEFNEKEPDALKEIEEGEEDLNELQRKLDELELPIYSVDSRREVPGGSGYKIYTTVSEIIDSLAKVFPIFLYFVAALVTLTTMTRFVNEERINSGTLKALGYTDIDIMKKFVIYGFLAGTIGTIAGVILGHTLLPFIVYNTYNCGFTLPQIELHFYPRITVVSFLLSLISSVLPPIIAVKQELQDKPARLLLPKSPKEGTKILLERITPIWKHLSFTHKVTCRNIFRYKSRMFMTIFGVAGSVTMLFAGFGVQGSISNINARQFEEIIKYDAIVALKEDLTENEKMDLENLLNSDEIDKYADIYYENITKVAGKNNDKQEITLIVTENNTEFRNFINLADRREQTDINLDEDGAVVSERLADLLNARVGDKITITDSKDCERTIKISGICEMYVGHFIFMNSEYFEEVYEDTYESNSKLLLLKDNSTKNTETQVSKFMELSSVKGIVQNTTMYNQIDTIVDSLDMIMKILIVIAGLLAVVILYNLTNINVSERIRELSTIKVLGFHDREVTMYIYRETIILTILGIIFGWFTGMWLHSYILNVVPPDEVMFDPKRWIVAYIIPLVIIIMITLLLKLFVNKKLKKVDMLEALKSVD